MALPNCLEFINTILDWRTAKYMSNISWQWQSLLYTSTFRQHCISSIWLYYYYY